MAVSYFSEYGTDFSVFNSGHGVLRRTVLDTKTGFEKRTMASSVCCFVRARMDVSKPVKGEGGGREPLTEAGLVKEENQKLPDVIANLLSIKFTVFVKRQTYHLNLKKKHKFFRLICSHHHFASLSSGTNRADSRY